MKKQVDGLKEASKRPRKLVLEGVWLEYGHKLHPATFRVVEEDGEQVEVHIIPADTLPWKAKFDLRAGRLEIFEGSKMPPDYKRNMVASLIFDDVLVFGSGSWMSRPDADLSHLPPK